MDCIRRTCPARGLSPRSHSATHAASDEPLSLKLPASFVIHVSLSREAFSQAYSSVPDVPFDKEKEANREMPLPLGGSLDAGQKLGPREVADEDESISHRNNLLAAGVRRGKPPVMPAPYQRAAIMSRIFPSVCLRDQGATMRQDAAVKLVPKRGLEPPPGKPGPDPESGASTNSATSAPSPLAGPNIRTSSPKVKLFPGRV